MSTDRMTEDEFADSRERHARWSAIVTLAVCSGLSIAGGVYYAAAYGAGDCAGMVATATLSLTLLLGIHLRASNAAALESQRVSVRAAKGSTVGGVVLVGMALVGNFSTLHALAVEKLLNPVAAVLTPLALDVGVITATLTLFALQPKLVRSRRTAAPKTAVPAASTAAPVAASTAASTTRRVPASITEPAAASTAVASSAADSTATADASPVVSPQVAPMNPPADTSPTDGESTIGVHRHHRAQELVSDGVVDRPVPLVAAALELLERGDSGRAVAAATGLDPRTVAKIRNASGAAQPRTLTAVR